MTLSQAPTRFVEAGGVRFSYRRLGPDFGVPLLCLQHFTGTMDSWDPAVIDALAATRPVVVFNNAGVGRSTGSTPDSVERMTADTRAFLGALRLPRVDLLGFSLGGFIAQMLAAGTPDLVRCLILAGTAPMGGEEHLLAVMTDAQARMGADDIRLPLFFTRSIASQEAGRAFLTRAAARIDDRDPDSTEAVSNPQARALIDWCAAPGGEALMAAIRQPTMVVTGSDDTMLPNANALRLYQGIADAQLILYPDSGHGALFQHAGLFVAHCGLFLDAP